MKGLALYRRRDERRGGESSSSSSTIESGMIVS
jgi:hypothetical protein